MKKTPKNKYDPIDPSLEGLTPRLTPITISALLSASEDTYNTSPPYQRQFAWPERKQIPLIESIIYRRSINAIHACKQPYVPGSTTKYFVIDGKQRIESIKYFAKTTFRTGEKPLKIWIKKKDGTPVYVSYSAIVEMAKEDENCSLFLDRFHSYPLQFEIYEKASDEQQIRLFVTLNNLLPITPNEKIFCPYFAARDFVRYLWENNFQKTLNPFVSKNISQSTRFSAYRFLIKFLQNAYGSQLADPDQWCHDAQGASNDDAIIALNSRIVSKYGGVTLDNWKTVFEYIFSEKQIGQMDDTLKCFKSVFNNHRDGLDKKAKGQDNIWVLDCLLWIRYSLQVRSISPSYVDIHWQKFEQMFIEFRDWRNLRENEILKTQPHRKGTLEKRLSYLESLFQSGKFGLDTGVKCKPVTSDKFGAVLKHPTVCPITGKILRGDNMDIDHVPAKSISSENNFVPIERGANRRKGNVDAEFQQKTLAYHIKHEASPIQVAPVQSDTASTSVAADSGSGL